MLWVSMLSDLPAEEKFFGNFPEALQKISDQNFSTRQRDKTAKNLKISLLQDCQKVFPPMLFSWWYSNSQFIFSAGVPFYFHNKF